MYSGQLSLTIDTSKVDSERHLGHTLHVFIFNANINVPTTSQLSFYTIKCSISHIATLQLKYPVHGIVYIIYIHCLKMCMDVQKDLYDIIEVCHSFLDKVQNRLSQV